MQPMPERAALRMLASRDLGMTRLRHLPKTSGMRPVANLSCKTAVRVPKRLRDGGGRKGRDPDGTEGRPICIDDDDACKGSPERGAVDAQSQAAKRRRQRSPVSPLPESLAFEPINRVLQPVHAALKLEAQHAARRAGVEASDKTLSPAGAVCFTKPLSTGAGHPLKQTRPSDASVGQITVVYPFGRWARSFSSH